MKKIILSNDTYQDMLKALKNADNQYEVGGILLGICDNDCIQVVTVTYPETVEKPLEFSFILDGEYHAHEATRKIAEYSSELDIVGLWHSHIYDVPYFSEQDNISNSIFCETFGEVISMIVYFSRETDEMKVIICNMISNNKEQECGVIIEKTADFIEQE